MRGILIPDTVDLQALLVHSTDYIVMADMENLSQRSAGDEAYIEGELEVRCFLLDSRIW